MDLKRYDIVTWIDTVWEGLDTLDMSQLSEESWDEVCKAICWITEKHGYELNEDGDYVEICHG